MSYKPKKYSGKVILYVANSKWKILGEVISEQKNIIFKSFIGAFVMRTYQNKETRWRKFISKNCLTSKKVKGDHVSIMYGEGIKEIALDIKKTMSTFAKQKKNLITQDPLSKNTKINIK
jgi:hypothetical protein